MILFLNFFYLIKKIKNFSFFFFSSLDEIKDDIVDNLKNYGINVNNIPLKEYFDDSFINKDEPSIPKEYKLNIIDERNNIYGEYNDNRYSEFVNEGKRIFLKYKTECNGDNKNLVLLSDECKFNDDIKIGGIHILMENGLIFVKFLIIKNLIFLILIIKVVS